MTAAPLDVTVHRLHCGADLVSKTVHSSKVETFAVVLNCGSADEDRGKRGLLHFVEHLVFHHARGGDIAGRFESRGANLSAAVRVDTVTYQIQGLRGSFPLLVEPFVRAIVAPCFRNSAVEREREVILLESSAVARTFADRASPRLLGAILGEDDEHLIRGTAEFVTNVELSMIRRTHSETHSAKNIRAIYIGPRPGTQVEELLSKALRTLGASADGRSSSWEGSWRMRQIGKGKSYFVCSNERESQAVLAFPNSGVFGQKSHTALLALIGCIEAAADRSPSNTVSVPRAIGLQEHRTTRFLEILLQGIVTPPSGEALRAGFLDWLRRVPISDEILRLQRFRLTYQIANLWRDPFASVRCLSCLPLSRLRNGVLLDQINAIQALRREDVENVRAEQLDHGGFCVASC
jgi:hypothetical protein